MNAEVDIDKRAPRGRTAAHPRSGRWQTLAGRLFLLFAAATLSSAAAAATPPGTVVHNTASVSYTGFASQREQLDSNRVELITKVQRTPAAIVLLRIAADGGESLPFGSSECSAANGTRLNAAPPIGPGGAVIDTNVAQAAVQSTMLHAGEAMFLRLDDADQNLDATVIETVAVNIESGTDFETVYLSETTPASGVFSGYLATTSSPPMIGDCRLSTATDSLATAKYQDPQDGSDAVSAAVLVDPIGVVFDALTGTPVDGVVVTLVNVDTGQRAIVIGDDMVSAYPAEVVSGGSATDANGTVYNFSPGQFRFPLVAPGTYRFEVDPPAGYEAPSSVSIADLQQLPGAPWALEDGSFGGQFLINPGPVVNIDIPLDPIATDLFMRKSTQSASAAPGDFVRYSLGVENVDSQHSVSDVAIIDVLPPGFRLMPGSVRMDGKRAADPAIDSDGRTLRFDAGRLAASGSRQIDYVAQVASAAAGFEAINVAWAEAPGGARSNDARVALRMQDDLMRSHATLVGRVLDGECSGREGQGIADVRVYLEDGRFAVTDEHGRYHFEGVSPGNHVVQMDLDSLPDAFEPAVCARNSRFAGRAFSQFADVRGGSLWRSDFHLRRKPAPSGAVQLALQSVGAMIGEELVYEVELQGGGVALEDLSVMIMLPDGVHYRPGSTLHVGGSGAEPRVSGNVLRFPLASRPAEEWRHSIQFIASLDSQAAGEYVTRAVAQFDTLSERRQRTPLAENVAVREAPLMRRFEYVYSPRFGVREATLPAVARTEIEQTLVAWQGASDIHVMVDGHTDDRPIALENRDEYPDNHALSLARARSVARVVGDLLQLPPERITVRGLGDTAALTSNATEAGRAVNRRVELTIRGERAATAGRLVLASADSGPQRVLTAGVQGGGSRSAGAAVTVVEESEEPIMQPEFAIVAPAPGYNPPIPSLRVAISHTPGQLVALQINGTDVSPLAFDGTATNGEKTAALSTWRGVDLQDGDNTVIAVVRSPDGSEQQRIVRDVHYSGGPYRAELAPELSTLIADGRTRPVIAVRVYDRWGYPARPDTVGTFRVAPPFRSWAEVEELQANSVLATAHREPVYRVADDGVAYIELEPTTRSGEAMVRFAFEDERYDELRAWIAPATRDWVLVGLAEGTIGYNTLRDNMQSARDAGLDEKLHSDGRVAFFAKGAIRGEFLLTMAFDSERGSRADEERLHGVIEPDRYYTLYGDTTESRYEAASQERLYIKLERGQFVALFGDYDTGLTVTELSRYSRSLNGLQSAWQGEHASYSAFAARTRLRYVRDELRGDGTSGAYRLRQSPLVINSDKIVLETRDRFHSETVVATRSLARHLDYSIDYLSGTIHFKEPVRSRDDGFNPVWIVADYESRDGGDKETTLGGRGALHLADGKIDIGVTGIREGATNGAAELIGTDLRARFGDSTELRAEMARSENGEDGASGAAWLAEVRHRGARLDARVYARDQDGEFGVGQQRGSEAGTAKIGVDGRFRMSAHLSLEAEAYQQIMKASDAQRDVAQVGVRFQRGAHAASVGLRSATDERLEGTAETRQAYVNASSRAMGDKVTLRLASDIGLGSTGNIDYPDRTLVGLDYAIAPAVTVFAEHEIATGSALESQMSRLGVRASPWNRAQFSASMDQREGEYGPRNFANVGLVQGWQASERWALDFGVDYSNTIAGATAEALSDRQPLASGSLQEDFSALFVGALYRGVDWTASARVERRDSTHEDRWGTYGGLYRDSGDGKGFSASLQYLSSERTEGVLTRDGDLQLGWVWRPDDSAWVVLNRLDFAFSRALGQGLDSDDWRVVNNLNANWQISPVAQLALQYGAKYVRANIDGSSYDGITDLYGADLRRDIGSHWDIGVHGSLLHSWAVDTWDYALGAEVGRELAANLWVSLGYNLTGYEDKDFSTAGFSARGPYLRFRAKADQLGLPGMRPRRALSATTAGGL